MTTTLRTSSLKNLAQGSHVHLMGICGTAMASLAGLLKDMGYKVTGSDSNPYPPMSTQIESLGIQIQKPYQASNLHPKPDFVVIGNVISANNPEAQEVMSLKIPFCSLPQAMGDVVIADRTSYVIAGTHGKTTTTSLMSWVSEKCQKNPGFLIGGIPKNFAKSFKLPEGNMFVIEGDEYDTAYFDKVPKFIHYKPSRVILTSVEFDHADIYADFTAVKSSFLKLMNLIPENGVLVYWGDDANVTEIAKTTKCKTIFSYGFTQNCDFKIKVIDEIGELTKFEVYHKNESLGLFTTAMTGRYNLLNVTAVIAMAYLNEFDFSGVINAISTFTGVKRRQEIIGEPRGITIIEDFAHHPTAVKETILAIQKKYPNRKVFSVFEPRSATSRRKVFQKDYVSAFSNAQEVLLAEAFDQTKIDETDRFSVAELISDLKTKGTKAQVFSGADTIVGYLKTQAVPKDVILIMSNGGFDGIYQKLIGALE